MAKVAMVTGGARGIGLEIVRNMVRDGYAVCVLDMLPYKSCEEAYAPLQETREIFYMQGSLASSDDRKKFVSQALSRYGRIDVLVNNAGVAPRVRQDLLSATEESFDFVIGINLKGTMFLTQLVASAMLSQPRKSGEIQGIIINISSFSATVSSPSRAEYCISKAGVSMLTRLFADRLAGEGVYVYEVQPGVIRTDMTSTVQEKYDRLLQGSEFPIHRWGTPQDVANVVSVFANGNMAYTTGQVIHVDGGYMNIRSI